MKNLINTIIETITWKIFTLIAVILILYYMIEEFKDNQLKNPTWYKTYRGWVLFNIIFITVSASTLSALGYTNNLTWHWIIPGISALYIAIYTSIEIIVGIKNFSKDIKRKWKR